MPIAKAATPDVPRGRLPSWRPSRDHWALVGLLAAGFVLRALGIIGIGHRGDVNSLLTWAEGMARYGLGYYAHGGDANYPPLLYLLWPLGIAFDGDPLRTAIRVLSIPFDLVLGALLWRLGRSSGRDRDGLWAAGLYLLNPAIIVSGPFWGQVDGIGALPMLASVAAIAAGRTATAGVLATLGGLIKPQFGIGAFVVVAIATFGLRSAEGVRRAAIVGLSAIVTFAIVMIPLGLGPTRYVDLVAKTAGFFPYTSLFGFNAWAIAFGFLHRDGPWFIVGATLTIAAIVLSLLLLRRRRDLVGLLAVGTLIALALYYLPTRVHERYLFGALVFLAPLAGMYPRLRLPFTALSAVFLVTLFYVLGNAPRPALPLPDWLRGDLAPWELFGFCAAVISAGLWCAWSLKPLFDRPTEPGPNDARAPGVERPSLIPSGRQPAAPTP
jgi:Gpi18-like mannosyltransferase